MKKRTVLLLMFAGFVLSAGAESRVWTSKSGQTLEGEYVRTAFDAIYIKKTDGEEVKIPIDQLADSDKRLVDLLNPPTLSIDYQESTPVSEFTADPWRSNGGSITMNHPIKYIEATFGALIKQSSSKEYEYDLTLEMYVFTAQHLDPDKYHMIAHVKGEPFRLSKTNKHRYVYTTPQTYRIMFYNLYSMYPRGEKPCKKYLILVRDERGEIIAYRSSSNWIYEGLEELEKLPVGSWINDKCKRVHPTSPPRTRRDSYKV